MVKIIIAAGDVCTFLSGIFFRYVKGWVFVVQIKHNLCRISSPNFLILPPSRKAPLAATNADAYVPSLVLGMPIKYCPRVNHLMHPSTDKISPIQSRRGFHNNRKKRQPSLFRPKAVISHYNLITICILITILFYTVRRRIVFEI